MNDLDNICYSKNFLNQVIVRVDFLQFTSTQSIFCTEIQQKILAYFPRKGKEQLIRFNSINVTFDPSNQNTPSASGNYVDGVQKEYTSSDGKNKVILSNQFLVFEINNYQSFEELSAWIQEILFAFFQKNRIVTSRVGIRYINLFEPEHIKVQKNYFSPEIAAILSTKFSDADTGLCLVRAMNISEFCIGSMKLNFRYGMYNPDYPNLLGKNSFSLDYDCFSEEQLDSVDDILRCLRTGHKAIQGLFEASITDKMRQVMRNE